MKNLYGIVWGYTDETIHPTFENEIYEDYEEALKVATQKNLSNNSEEDFDKFREYFRPYLQLTNKEIAKLFANRFVYYPKSPMGFCTVYEFVFKPARK